MKDGKQLWNEEISIYFSTKYANVNRKVSLLQQIIIKTNKKNGLEKFL